MPNIWVYVLGSVPRSPTAVQQHIFDKGPSNDKKGFDCYVEKGLGQKDPTAEYLFGSFSH